MIDSFLIVMIDKDGNFTKPISLDDLKLKNIDQEQEIIIIKNNMFDYRGTLRDSELSSIHDR